MGWNIVYQDPQVPEWLVGASVGQWIELSGTALSSVTTAPGTPVTEAWNGAAVDQESSRLWIVANGGHNDSGWNGAVVLNVNQDAPAWQVRFAGSSVSDNANTPYNSDGRPASRHTYYSKQWIPERNRVFMFGCGALAGDGVTAPNVDAFNAGTNDYDAEDSYDPLPGGTPGAVALTTARDGATGNVYVCWAYGGSQRLARWTQSTATITELAQPPFLCYGYYAPSAVDTTRNRFVVFEASQGTDDACLYSISGNSWSTVSMGASMVPDSSAVFYVPTLDLFIGRDDDAGGGVVQINPTTFAVSAFTTSGGGTIPASVSGNGCFSRFAYMPALGGAVYMPRYNTNCWFLKLHEV